MLCTCWHLVEFPTSAWELPPAPRCVKQTALPRPFLPSRPNLCSADFPETGGASIREMASEIGHNIGERLGVHQKSDTAVNTKVDEALDRVSGKVANAATAAVDKAKEAVTGSKYSKDEDRRSV